MRRLIAPLFLASLVAMSVTPSHATGYDIDYGAIRGAQISVQLIGGGVATASVLRFQNVQVAGQGTARPRGAEPTKPPEFFGCITVSTSRGTEGSCDVQAPVNIDYDPALMTGSVTFTVCTGVPPCPKQGAKLIVASLLFTGNPTGLGVGEVPLPKEDYTFLRSGPVLRRAATVIGSIRSDNVGGGSIVATNSAVMYEGADGHMTLYK